MRLTLVSALCMCLVSTNIRAQPELAGTWSDAKFTLELNVARGTAIGVVAEKGQGTSRFSDGSLDGNKVVFTTVTRLNGEDIVLEWRGEVTGDELTLTRDFPSKRPLRRPYPPFNGPFLLHRSK